MTGSASDAGERDEAAVVGQRHADLDPAVAVDRHRRSTDDRARSAGSRPSAEPIAVAASRRAARPGSPGAASTLHRTPAPASSSLVATRVNARAVQADLQREHLAPVDGSPHGHAFAFRRGQGGELDLELPRREDRLRLEPLPGLVGALLRGPERPVQPVPRRARLERARARRRRRPSRRTGGAARRAGSRGRSRSTTSFPTLTSGPSRPVLALHLGEVADDLGGQVARGAQAAQRGARLDEARGDRERVARAPGGSTTCAARRPAGRRRARGSPRPP